MRHFYFPFRTSVASLFLLVSLASCGEMELPQHDDAPNSSTEQPKDGTPGDDNSDGDTPGDDNTPGESNSDDATSGDNNNDSATPGDADTPVGDLRIGNACLTLDGHLLIADRLYLSLEEFWSVSSAGGAHPTQAAELAAAYVEGNLKDWRVPTAQDVIVLQEALACVSPLYADEGTETLPLLNRELDARGYCGLYREWYIYGDAFTVFGFTFETTTTKASAKTLYRLRLVHDK